MRKTSQSANDEKMNLMRSVVIAMFALRSVEREVNDQIDGIVH
jgi:hypothetical protein